VLFYVGRDKKLWRTDGTAPARNRSPIESWKRTGTRPDIAAYGGLCLLRRQGQRARHRSLAKQWHGPRDRPVRRFAAGQGNGSPDQFVATTDRLYFVDSIFLPKQHLWQTDGKSVEIAETVNARFSGFNVGITQLTAVGGSLYFCEDETNTVGGADSVWRITGQPDSLRRIGRFTLPRIISKDSNSGPAKRIYFYEPDGVDRPPKAIYAAKDGRVTVVKSDTDRGIERHPTSWRRPFLRTAAIAGDRD